MTNSSTLSQRALVGYLGSGLILTTLGRLLPHPPNMTPLTAVAMMTAIQLPLRITLPFMLSALLLSDLLLAIFYHYPAFGSWTLFTWSGYLLISIMVKYGYPLNTPYRKTAWFITIFIVSLFYWLWSNFGCWLISNLYPHNWAGLLDGYVAALPFLRNALLGNLLWSATILILWHNRIGLGRIWHDKQHTAGNSYGR